MATTTSPLQESVRELNGWNLDQFNATVENVKKTPQAGVLTWRSRVAWDSGFGGDAHTREIEQLGHVMRRRFTVRSDHPPELLGDNTGPTAVEILLSGLGACIMGTYAAHATARGLRLDDLEVELEGTIDLNGFLQLAPTPPGLQDVRAVVRVASDASDAELQELLEVTKRASPVYDSISNPVQIASSVERRRR